MTEKCEVKCKDCKHGPAAFFHSRCCDAHFEGIILEETQEIAIACEKCGKFVAKIQHKLNDKEDNKNE